MTFHYRTLEQMVVATAESVRPPERLTVSEAAAKYRKLNNPGSYVGPWQNETTPYLIEPMDVLNSTEFTGMIFVGPAQCGKTDMLMNWLTHTAICDPADTMIIQMSRSTARDFAKRRIERLLRHTPEIAQRVMPGRQNQNTFDTTFISGWLLSLSWPTINELSGKPVPRVWLTDYDRMPQNVDHEGSPYFLAKKRTTTFMRYGMTAAESSPGFEVENPKYIPRTPHEAPPTKGILSLYNQGDRRRYYWRCPHCRTAFEPDFHMLRWPDTTDHMEAAEGAYIACPHCDNPIHHDEGPGQPGKVALNGEGRWVKDGMIWRRDGTFEGESFRSESASFWLKGVCATFAPWKTLVFNYLKAMEDFEMTGSIESLKTTVNTDQGNPFVPPKLAEGHLPEDLQARSKDLGEHEVPEGVRFITASIDLQANRFVVQVHGHGIGGDIYVIDRFEIKKSERVDEDGERLWVKPGVYIEDWYLLVDQVITKTYPLRNDPLGRRMMIKAIVCDSGGNAGMTKNAYDFWRWLRDHADGSHHRRFQLLKGNSSPSAPRALISYPDSERKDRKAGARGEVPVLMINTNMIKDQVSAMLDRTMPDGGMIYFPDWLPSSFFTELTVENRTTKGWENPKKLRNESWDLLVYAIALNLSRHVKSELIDWAEPPDWAEEWDRNSLVYTPDNGRKPFETEESVSVEDLSNLGELLG